MIVVTPSFLSLSRAPCRKSLDTSSFSSNHMITKGSNQLQEEERTSRGRIKVTASQVNIGCDAFTGSLRWIFRYVLLECGQVFAVLVVEPLHLEMQVHIICTFTESVLLML